MTLKDLLMAVAFGAVAPTAAYFLTGWLRDKHPEWTFFGTWSASIGISVLIAWIAWVVGLVMYYFPVPADSLAGWRAWVEAAFAIAMPVGTIAAGIHAKVKAKTMLNNGRKV